MRADCTLRVGLLLAALGSLGCKDKGGTGHEEADTDTDADTDADTDTDAVFEDELAVRDVSIAGGWQLPLMTGGALSLGEDETCPIIAKGKEDGDYSIMGGCTSADGRAWTGAWFTDGSTEVDPILMTYDGFGWTRGDDSVLYDGSLTISAPSGSDTVFYAEVLSITLAGEPVTPFYYGPWPGAGRSVSVTYSEYTYSVTPTEGPNVLTSASGELTIDGLGTWTVTSEIELWSECDSEARAGSLVAAGDDTLTVTYDGETECDGCSLYSTASGISGELCVGSE